MQNLQNNNSELQFAKFAEKMIQINNFLGNGSEWQYVNSAKQIVQIDPEQNLQILQRMFWNTNLQIANDDNHTVK